MNYLACAWYIVHAILLWLLLLLSLLTAPAFFNKRKLRLYFSEWFKFYNIIERKVYWFPIPHCPHKCLFFPINSIPLKWYICYSDEPFKILCLPDFSKKLYLFLLTTLRDKLFFCSFLLLFLIKYMATIIKPIYDI